MARKATSQAAAPREAQVQQYHRLPITGVPGWITVDEAWARLRDRHGVALSREMVQRGALRYRHRMEGRARDDQPVDPEAALREDPAPEPRELRSVRVGEGHRSYTLIEDTEANLARFAFRKPGEAGPGRRAGATYTKREPRPTTRAGRASAARSKRASRPRAPRVQQAAAS